MEKLIGPLLLFIAFGAAADTPGKAKNNPSKVSFQNISMLKDYDCYWTTHYGHDTVVVKSDTTLVVSGSAGKPDAGIFWAINKKTGVSTDTLSFDNYYAPDKVAMIKGVNGNHIAYETASLSNENKIIKDKNDSLITNKDLVKEAHEQEKKHSNKVIFIVAASVLAAGLLVWLFIRRRKKAAESVG